MATYQQPFMLLSLFLSSTNPLLHIFLSPQQFEYSKQN